MIDKGADSIPSNTNINFLEKLTDLLSLNSMKRLISMGQYDGRIKEILLQRYNYIIELRNLLIQTDVVPLIPDLKNIISEYM